MSSAHFAYISTAYAITFGAIAVTVGTILLRYRALSRALARLDASEPHRS